MIISHTLKDIPRNFFFSVCLSSINREIKMLQKVTHSNRLMLKVRDNQGCNIRLNKTLFNQKKFKIDTVPFDTNFKTKPITHFLFAWIVGFWGHFNVLTLIAK